MDEIITKKKYTEAQKRATKKYRENNKDKVNAQRKEYYNKRKEIDPNFLEYKRIKAKEYYQIKKGLKKAIVDEKPVIEEIIVVEEKPVIVETPIIDETIQEKKKRKYNKKVI
jgi:hypothetical protein